MSAPDPLDRIRDNPFYVLGLRPSATRAEIEREGQKLFGMLELKLASAATYATPVGLGARTDDKVRRAMAELRDPERRLGHELWARLDPLSAAPSSLDDADDEDEDTGLPEVPSRGAEAPWAEALAALGWLGGAP